MKHKLTKAEQETVINFDNELDTASIYTHDSRLIKKLRELRKQYPEQFILEHREHGSVTYTIPKRCVGIRPPYSEKRREQQRQEATDQYAILQLRRIEDTVYERFSSMRELERMGLEPDIDHYEVVYTAPLLPYKDQNTMLEELYAKFNVSRPDDFTGHSLSVSDIVALRQNGVVSCHYVDSIGFQELPGFLKPENYLKAAEMAMEDDYGMIDGVINNGKKEEPAEKASVLDQLKEKQEAVPPASPRRCCEEKEL